MDDPLWLLGFVEEAKPARLLRHHFPSKVGGRPAWLNPVSLPTEDQLRCPYTGGIRNFLLQIYAPVFENESAFHRTIFVFISPNGNEVTKKDGCCAFRSQLPRENPFYSSLPPLIHDLVPQSPGVLSVHDPWDVANYEQAFQQGIMLSPPVGLRLFPEKNLLVVEESSETEDETIEGELESKDFISKQEEYAKTPKSDLDEEYANLMNRVPVTEFEKLENCVLEKELAKMENCISKEQCDFIEFQDRIRNAPAQCLRYCFEDDVSPLWPNRQGPMIDQIPNCEICGAKRRFEFQILPQMLNHLDCDPLDSQSYDWGTIAIYSCSESCSIPGSPAYIPEFVFVQPM